MSKFKLEFETDGDAFADGELGGETARILRALAAKLEGENDPAGGSVFDLNGNRCGRWGFSPEMMEQCP